MYIGEIVGLDQNMDCIWTEVYVTIYIQKGIAVLEIVNKLLSLSYCLIISEHVPDSVRL